MKKNKLLTTAVALSVLATAGIATVPVQANVGTAGQTGEAPVTVMYEEGVISVSVPTAFEFSMTAAGKTTTETSLGEDNCYIQNSSLAPISIVNVDIPITEGWSVKPLEEFDNAKENVDDKTFAMKVNGMNISNDGASPLKTSLSDDAGVLFSDQSTTGKTSKYVIDTVDASFALQSEGLAKSTIASIVITVDWATQAQLDD